MRFPQPTKVQMLRYLQVFKPKSFVQKVCVLVYALCFAAIIAPRLNNNPGKIVLTGLAALFVAGAWLLPISVINRWEHLGTRLRGGSMAIFIYVLTVTLGWLPDLRSPSAWTQLLLLSGGAPFSSVHTLALFGMVPAWLSQSYYPAAAPLSLPEHFIRGTPEEISGERAIMEMEAIGDRCGWDDEVQETATLVTTADLPPPAPATRTLPAS
jgi:hypothetical protein